MEGKLKVEYVDPNSLKVFDYSRNLFPKLQGEAYEFLKEDIKENGIRTPLEITKENVILCGHERHRVALELGLKEVPIIINLNQIVDQKRHCIKDNLARKAVDTRTKLRCYVELKALRGIKQRNNPKNEYGQYRKVSDSVDSTEATVNGSKCESSDAESNTFMTNADIAKEVGLPEATLDRAVKIEESKELPEEIKEATFKGKMGIRTVSEMLDESEEVKAKVVPKILEELKSDKEHIYVQDIVDDVKDADQPSGSMEVFLSNYAESLKHTQTDYNKQHDENGKYILTEADKKSSIIFFKKLITEKHIVCPVCGETHIQWKCGHEL